MKNQSTNQNMDNEEVLIASLNKKPKLLSSVNIQTTSIASSASAHLLRSFPSKICKPPKQRVHSYSFDHEKKYGDAKPTASVSAFNRCSSNEKQKDITKMHPKQGQEEHEEQQQQEQEEEDHVDNSNESNSLTTTITKSNDVPEDVYNKQGQDRDGLMQILQGSKYIEASMNAANVDRTDNMYMMSKVDVDGDNSNNTRPFSSLFDESALSRAMDGVIDNDSNVHTPMMAPTVLAPGMRLLPTPMLSSSSSPIIYSPSMFSTTLTTTTSHDTMSLEMKSNDQICLEPYEFDEMMHAKSSAIQSFARILSEAAKFADLTTGTAASTTSANDDQNQLFMGSNSRTLHDESNDEDEDDDNSNNGDGGVDDDGDSKVNWAIHGTYHNEEDESRDYFFVQNDKIHMDEDDTEDVPDSNDLYINTDQISQPCMIEFNPYIFMGLLPPYEHAVACSNSLQQNQSSSSGTTPTQLLPSIASVGPKHSLILDLDETLVHCSIEKTDNYDLIFEVEFGGSNCSVYVRRRPYLQEFLEQMSQLYEITVFTASQKAYAEKMIDILDPQGIYIKHRLYRDSCLIVGGNYLKDISILGRDLSTTVIIDNSPHAFGYQITNGIPISSWYEDPSDTELRDLMPFLKELTLSHVQDVRLLIHEKYRTSEVIHSALQSASHHELILHQPQLPVLIDY